ncbi:hypothetical protein GRZ55_11000 [Chelativorans sp. ZYF759]|uniref:dCTP deaminase domain-containing protein n=1 Tax=Chelativorans sp. ZYF759 TaxID=2692213 RepID=UPI00145C7678|nr:hypothetical protein [Chelativorans sp. ZYF759]NMG39770.1 hypothetical protein [Chelativorans sp. ZYF759]
MTLVSASGLDHEKFFKEGIPRCQGSSFDLTIGKIYDCEGQEVNGPYILAPGHMVQVVSNEVFDLPPHITGHVTYKTGLTSQGIWALTVGIVDPGWDGPVATTLLNFRSTKFAIHQGEPFLRVSLFEHEPVSKERIRKAPDLKEYLKTIQNSASTIFPETFLNTDDLARKAGERAVKVMRNWAAIWIAGIALIL